MKFFLKHLILIALLVYSQASYSDALRQDSVKTTIVGSFCRTTFYVYAPTTQSYNLKFWIMGVFHDGQANSSYSVSVDGMFIGYVYPDRGDWCLCSPANGSPVSLTEGSHQIYLEGYWPDVPNAEAVVASEISYPHGMYLNPDITYSSCYEKMKNHQEYSSIESPIFPDTLNTNYRQINYHPVEQDSLMPPFHYTAELNKNVYYTFCRLEYYMQGEMVDVTTWSEDNLQRVVHVFSQESGGFSYTSPAMTTYSDGCSCVIPETGFYYVMVRSYSPDDWGTCDVRIQNGVYNARYFEDVPINCSFTPIESPAANKDYACFAMSNNCDPLIFLMGPGNGGGIVRHNDDFTSSRSCFDWEKNARVDGGLTNGQWILTSTKSFPTLRFKKCDIYTRCEKSRYIDPDLPNYNFDDNIISSAETPTPPWYNCLSWALDEWMEALWFDCDYDNNECVDSVLATYGYYPDSSESTTTLDMWADVYSDGDFLYTHASVKSKSHPHAGGYAWESKLADSFRVFHDRYALEGGQWGEVLRHYKKSNLHHYYDPYPYPYPGELVFLNVNLTGDELGEIENGVQLISSELTAEFTNLYEECKAKGSKKASIFIDSFEKADSYRPLLEFCVENPVLSYLLYKKICEREILAIKLLKDFTLSGNQTHLWKEAVDNVRQLCNKKSDVKCLHTARTYGMYLVKLLLSSQGDAPAIVQSISYSDSPVLQVRAADRRVSVSFDLESDAVVSVYLGSKDGTTLKGIINNKLLETGTHSLDCQVSKPGYYTVGLVANGSIYRKSIIVR